MPFQPKMTEDEASQILQWLKQGKTYKTGHYHYGYMFYSYEQQEQKVRIHTQDLSVDIYNPTETTEFVSQEIYIQRLMQYETFEDIKNRISG